MPNLITIEYEQTGASVNTANSGMRPMAARAYEQRTSQYLIIKAPPASGKSRALMFIALHKLRNQGLKKVIVAVPERSIGSSFSPADLIGQNGFFENWNPNDRYNLCTPGSDGSKGKVESFREFLSSDEEILICTHATLRFAAEGLENSRFDDTLLAIDEFHHVSADINNRLGDLLRGIMSESTAHIVAMTGSYFRGDSVPILTPEEESSFTKVTYNYYEQLNGYSYLKSLGIGYHFYDGKYTSAISEVLDTDKKTILHIPNVNSGESTKKKHEEVDFIIDAIGTVQRQDPHTGVIFVERHGDGKVIKVADLVEDTPSERDKIVDYLRGITELDDMDLIIALGMAKEGFDWPFCEHALTVGYRGSLTEIIQIIGRATRDSENKSHAQFTNLIAQPEADDELVKFSVNNMLKAITVSLLMEQVLAPSWNFRSKQHANEKAKPGDLGIKGFAEPSSARVKDILESDLNDLKAGVLQDSSVQRAMISDATPEYINQILIPKVIQTKYPDLKENEIEEIRHHLVSDLVLNNAEIKDTGGQRFIRMANTFVNIDDLHIDLIDSINPFQKAFEILSKSVDESVLRVIQETINASRITMDFEEAKVLWPKIKQFRATYGRGPSIRSSDPQEVRMAECIIYLKEEKRKRSQVDG